MQLFPWHNESPPKTQFVCSLPRTCLLTVYLFLLQDFLQLLIPVIDRMLIQDWAYCSVVVRSCHWSSQVPLPYPKMRLWPYLQFFLSILYFLCVISSFEAKIPLIEGWHKKQDLSSSSLVRWTFLIFPASSVTENEVHFQNTPFNMFCMLLWNSYHFLPLQFCRELLILKISESGEICRNITL